LFIAALTTVSITVVRGCDLKKEESITIDVFIDIVNILNIGAAGRELAPGRFHCTPV
jgi:hypothetical protein